jgi:hypothetical protein
MSTQHNDDEQTINLTRRQALKGAAVGTAAAGVGLNTPVHRARAGWFDDDDNSDGSPGLSVVSPGLGLVSATAKVLGWTSGDSNNSGAKELRKSAYWDASRYYRSVSRELALSQSLLDYAPDGIFSDAKIRAIEKMNAGATKSDTKTAALDVARQEAVTLEKNVLDAGSAGIDTLNNYAKAAVDAGVSVDNVVTLPMSASITRYDGTALRDVTLLNGNNYEVTGFNYQYTEAGTSYSENTFAISEPTSYSDRYYSVAIRYTPVARNADKTAVYPTIPTNIASDGDYSGNIPAEYDATQTGEKTIEQMRNDVVSMWNNDLKPDIQNWVDYAYDKYASGEVQPEDLLSPSEVATLISDEEPANRALAHLRASGISVKPDNPATIETTVQGGTVTVANAVLGSTGTSASLSVGDQVDPSTLSYDYTVGYTSDNVAVDWPHYTETLDGGQLTVGKSPSTEVVEWVGRPLEMVIQTSKGETATIDPYAHGSPENPSAGFTVDLSGQLNEPIANVTQITIFSAKSDPVSATKILDNTFTLTDGAKDTYDFTHDRSIQTTDNYVTAEEWEQRNEELQQTIEELRNDDSGGSVSNPAAGFLSGFNNLGTGVLGAIGSVVSLLVGGVFVFFGFILLIVILGAASG